jgi:nicotinate-nucleotide adenylyltransferase
LNTVRDSRRIGLFGGTFDPPHNAHVALAQAAVEAVQLDQLRWIPAGQPWQKARQITPAPHREAMVNLALQGSPHSMLDRCELDRSGPSYTLDTVTALQTQHPKAQIFLIIGSDQYAGLHTWRGWQELLCRVVLAVANRPGAAVRPDAQVLLFSHRVVPLPMLDISSTDIRARVARRQPIDHLVPAAVARYIEDHHLYRN